MHKIGAGAIPFVQLPGIDGKNQKGLSDQEVQSTVVVHVENFFWRWLLKYAFKEKIIIPIFSAFH